jgi:glycine cleavage system H protein
MECNGCEFHPELYYDAEFQIWVRVEADGALTLGMTDIAQTIAGRILNVRVRRPGTARPAGRPVATIESGKWAGPVPNPFDCTIAGANREVLEEPALLNRVPYDAWIARVTPAAPPALALARLLTGDAAWDGFCRRCRRDDIRCTRLDG